ncbi:Dabb family protein [Meridianimarinicoccus sp. RP-17]|uniref:Dabb family protein n=1 Tax=Meridianimarinicoccus zhengii TaxID=2056810 RepID=UPI000DAEAD07|nr:Dabb family protein [Phycocomes zhengii]
MIRHIVLVKFKPQTAESEITAILDGLAALVSALPGARGFSGGRSESPEGMERGYTHGFVIDFDGWADLETYATDATHRALGARLAENAVDGRNGILVMDIDIAG